MINVFMVGVGGFVGAVLRYLIAGWAAGLWLESKFPLGTFLVNLTGCLLIGFLFRLAENIPALGDELRPLIFVGLLGGFTTFSAFGLETFDLHRTGALPLALLYAVGSVIGGVLLTWIGFMIAAALFPVE